MHIDDPHWADYEDRFRALAEQVPMHKGPRTELASAAVYLCLYGDNAMSPERELDVLSRLEKEPDRVKGLAITTSYWEDLMLYIP